VLTTVAAVSVEIVSLVPVSVGQSLLTFRRQDRSGDQIKGGKGFFFGCLGQNRCLFGVHDCAGSAKKAVALREALLRRKLESEPS
jgi:hypothetical protein